MIPSSFELGGLKFKTEIVNFIGDRNKLGQSIPALCKIAISEKYANEKIPNDSMERTFYHELVHSILIELGEIELSNNERFVDSFSSLLYQFEKTKN